MLMAEISSIVLNIMRLIQYRRFLNMFKVSK